MAKRFTIGITTHNEEATIARLLGSLYRLPADDVDIILYDDCSDDKTRAIVEVHPIALRSNFHAHFADFNNGTPSVGRTYIGHNAKTEYTALIDGDDHVDVVEFQRLIKDAPSEYDMILTTYILRDQDIMLGIARGEFELNNTSVMRLLSGIGGKIYRSNLLAEFGSDDTKGRSDDVRLNMRILSANARKLFSMPEIRFYRIEESRKSARVKTLNFDEFNARVEKYEYLQSKYSDLDKRYLGALKRNLRKTVREDESVPEHQKRELIAKINEIVRLDLKRIVLIGDDIDSIGGIPGRLRRTISAAQGRDVEYLLLCRNKGRGIPNAFEVDDPDSIVAMLRQWTSSDTVIITANNIMRRFPKKVQRRLRDFPIIYMCSAQMAFMIQDSSALADMDYVEQFLCSRIIAFSDADISFQRQLGIHGQIKGFLPVAVRSKCNFAPSLNNRLGYVGRIDFHSKGCERLIDVGKSVKENGLPPIRIFTVEDINSPDYNRFRKIIDEEGLGENFEFILGCTDTEVIYNELSFILLPSKKESFGNVVLEAFSYGVPVISTTYAPGPAEIIDHGKNGYLLDDFSGEAVVDLVKQANADCLERMSKFAFEKHRHYSMEAHLEFLEKVAHDVVNTFSGKNELPVFPKLKILNAPPKGETKAAKIVSPSPSMANKVFKPTTYGLMRRREYAAELLAPLETEIANIERRRNRTRQQPSN